MGVVVSGASSGLPQFCDFARVARARQLEAQLPGVLSESSRLISDGLAAPGMDLLASHLLALRESLDAQKWEQVCQTIIHHPIAELVWQDPFTFHSYRKPCGYSGDAQLLDYIYGKTPAPDEISAPGRQVFTYMMEQLGALGVRSRRKVLAQIIDRTACESRSPRILSIACGHLREAELSSAINNRAIGEFLALDQDANSLEQVSDEFGQKGIQTVHGSVRSILAEKLRFENLNLVYAAGLFDYLTDRVAIRLARLMFDMLAPGGRLVIANFAPVLPEAGYMEALMDWKLIYRQPHELLALAQQIDEQEWASNCLFWDEHESIVFLDLVKRPATLQVTAGKNGHHLALPGLQKVAINPQKSPRPAGIEE